MAGLFAGLAIFLSTSQQRMVTGMPYALIAWKPPADASETDIAGIEADLQSLSVIPFFRGFGLVNDETPDWKALRASLSAAVASHSGMEVMLMIPSKGNRIGGWLENVPPTAELNRARKLMNQSGSDTYPVLEQNQ
jgi:hypothetical protein